MEQLARRVDMAMVERRDNTDKIVELGMRIGFLHRIGVSLDIGLPGYNRIL